MHLLIKLLFLLVIPTLLAGGCTAFNTYPQSARAGDTITLAVGSPDDMTRTNTTATFTSEADPLNPIDLTSNIRAVFKLYADKASPVYEDYVIKEIVRRSGHAPWVTMVMIDLPPSLPEGLARIELNTPASYPASGSHINDLSTTSQRIVDDGLIDPPIALEILPGSGAPADFPLEIAHGGLFIGDLTLLEPQLHAQISPPFEEGNPLGWPKYGAVELTLTLDTDTPLSDTLYRLVPDDMSIATNSQYSLVSTLDGDELTVIFLSPKGVLQYFEPRFAVVLDSDVHFSTVTEPVSLSSVRYYDMDGNPLTGPSVFDYLVEIR